MSGRKIEDHAFWAGGKSKGSVFPEGAKTKEESSADGAGHLGQYEDTTEAIKSMQEAGKKKIHSHEQPSGRRN